MRFVSFMSFWMDLEDVNAINLFQTNKVARARSEIIFHNCAEAKRANRLCKKVFQTLHIFSVTARTTASNQNNHSLKVFFSFN